MTSNNSNTPVAFGIDIGSSKIVIALCVNEKADVVVNSGGGRTTPFCVAFNYKERFLASAAEYQATVNPNNTIFGKDVLRTIGRPINEMDKENFVVKIQEQGPRNNVTFVIEYKQSTKLISPENALSMVLFKATEHIKSFYDQKVLSAVVTVPSMFNSTQRYEIKNACKAAGLEILSLLNNATASAITYSLERFNGDSKNILIFDMGSTSLDVGIFELRGNHIITKWIEGDLNLGGENFVEVLVKYFLEEFLNENKVDLRNNEIARIRMRNACESVKKILSTSKDAAHIIDTFHDGNSFQMNITRADFENRCSFIFDKIKNIVSSTIEQSGIKVDDINEFIVVGGGGRIPKIEEILKDLNNKKELSKVLNQDESPAFGAAYLACNQRMKPKQYKVQKLQVHNIACLPIKVQLGWFGSTIVAEKDSTLPLKHEIKYELNGQQILQFFQSNCVLYENIFKCDTIQILEDVTYDGLLKILAKIKYNESIYEELIINQTEFDNQKIDEFIKHIIAFKKDEEELKENLELRNTLEDRCYKFIRSTESRDLKDIFSEESKRIVVETCRNLISWLYDNLNIGNEELNKEIIKVRDICWPIIKNAEKNAKLNSLKTQADSFAEKGENEAACKLYTDGITFYNENKIDDAEMLKSFYWSRCDVSFMLAHYREAITDCDSIIKMNGAEWKAFKIRGQCNFNLTRFDECKKDFEQFLRHENDEDVHQMITKADEALEEKYINDSIEKSNKFRNKQDYDKALKIFNELVNRPSLKTKKYENLMHKVHYLRGESLFDSENYHLAIEDFAIASTNTDFFLKALDKSTICKIKIGQYEDALIDFDILKDNNPSSQLKKHINFAKKMVYCKQVQEKLHECEEALKTNCYQKVLDILDKIIDEYLNQQLKLTILEYKIQANHKLERHYVVKQLCDQVLNIDNGHIFAYQMKITACMYFHHYLQVIDICKSAKDFTDASDYTSKLYFLHHQITANFRMNRNNEVLKLCKEALAIDSKYSHAYHMQISIFAKQNNFKEAIKVCDLAMDKNPGQEWIDVKFQMEERLKNQTPPWYSSWFSKNSSDDTQLTNDTNKPAATNELSTTTTTEGHRPDNVDSTEKDGEVTENLKKHNEIDNETDLSHTCNDPLTCNSSKHTDIHKDGHLLKTTTQQNQQQLLPPAVAELKFKNIVKPKVPVDGKIRFLKIYYLSTDVEESYLKMFIEQKFKCKDIICQLVTKHIPNPKFLGFKVIAPNDKMIEMANLDHWNPGTGVEVL